MSGYYLKIVSSLNISKETLLTARDAEPRGRILTWHALISLTHVVLYSFCFKYCSKDATTVQHRIKGHVI